MDVGVIWLASRAFNMSCTFGQSVRPIGRRYVITLQLRHNELDGVSNHRLIDCLLNRLFRRRSKNTSKFRVTGLCKGNSPMTVEFLIQRASNAENDSIWWRFMIWSIHHTIQCVWWLRPINHFIQREVRRFYLLASIRKRIALISPIQMCSSAQRMF